MVTPVMSPTVFNCKPKVGRGWFALIQTALYQHHLSVSPDGCLFSLELREATEG